MTDKILGVGAQEPKRLLPHGVDHVTGQFSWLILRVRVPIQVRVHLLGETVDGGPGIDSGAAMVKVDSYRGVLVLNSLDIVTCMISVWLCCSLDSPLFI